VAHLAESNHRHPTNKPSRHRGGVVVRALAMGILGIAIAIGITSVIVQLLLIVAPTFLVNWYAWLTVDVLVIIGAIGLHQRSRALASGVGIGAIVLTIGIITLAIGQLSWHYELTPTHPAVDRNPTIDAIFLGPYWQSSLGKAQAATELGAFHVYQSSGWWRLLAPYGVGPLTLTGCAIVPHLIHATSLDKLVTAATEATGSACPGSITPLNRTRLLGADPPEVVIFAGPDQFLGQHLSESGWNFLTNVDHHQLRAAVILDGSLKIAQGADGRLIAITPVEDTTLTLSHELAEGTTSLGPRSISVAASTLSRFSVATGASILYALSSQWGNIVPFLDSQPTDILQVADACTPGQPAFVPSPSTSYRFVDGIGMVSLLSRSGTTCENISHGSVVRFPQP
jgi:hypothetical protein